MTTPIMHVIPANDIIQNIFPKLNQINMIDVGMGRGYLA